MMSDFENAVEVKNLTKKYDGFTLDNVSFTVPKGSIMGFIGQNGAGKSTTINALLGIIKPDSGEISLLGENLFENEAYIKKNVAAVFDEIPFNGALSAKQVGFIMGGIFTEWDKEKYNSLLERFSLPLKKPLGKFSKGMKMKLQIAAALSHGAKLLIMDEATTGLDPVVRNEILDIFMEYIEDEDHSILMSSHITSDLEKIADSVTFIDKGKILVSGYKDDILASHALIKCGRADYGNIAGEDIVSARLTDFGAEVMVSDAQNCRKKYPSLVFDTTTLDEIMVYYVNREKKEWS